jgi:hypothetical protein
MRWSGMPDCIATPEQCAAVPDRHLPGSAAVTRTSTAPGVTQLDDRERVRRGQAHTGMLVVVVDDAVDKAAHWESFRLQAVMPRRIR